MPRLVSGGGGIRVSDEGQAPAKPFDSQSARGGDRFFRLRRRQTRGTPTIIPGQGWSPGWSIGVGVEGTGSYGAGLARHLAEAGIEVVGVNRPNRQLRRQKGGKTDSVDAEAAARAAASPD